MRKKDVADQSGSEWDRPAGGRVSPLDVQQKEFRVTRVGVGYRMREVDEFLDQVTDTLSALIAENEQLRASSGGASATSAPDIPPGATASSAERAAVDAFLQREKGFLQNLGGLVQAHAEELRSMIRATRDAPPPVAVAREEPVPEQEPVVEQEPVAESVAETEAVAEGEEPAPTERVDEAPSSEPIASGEDEGHEPAAITGVIAEEPIRLEDPEPARSRRSEEKEGDSLRELFWGED
ncbi:MAG: DivIVA protein [Actinomycetia bacterium]|jgi:DivIVA domain-containing protein|nr:DivIVA protein [Actinomycetes bacterium]